MIRWLYYCLQPLISFWQRGRRGWADEDTGWLSDYLAEVIAGAVGYLRENGHGYSCTHGLDYDQHVCTPEGWENVLQRIEFGMRYWKYAEEHELDDITFNDTEAVAGVDTAYRPGIVFPKISPDNWMEITDRRAERKHEIMKMALSLLTEHWPALWD